MCSTDKRSRQPTQTGGGSPLCQPNEGGVLQTTIFSMFCNGMRCVKWMIASITLVPDLKDTVQCPDQTDHCNQLGGIARLECNPNREYF